MSIDVLGDLQETVSVPAPPDLGENSPDGLALVDADGVVLGLNPAGEGILGRSRAAMVGQLGPFGADAVAVDESVHERTVTWTAGGGARRELAFSSRAVAGSAGDRVVAFRDVTRWRGQQRRLAAIGRGAASFTVAGSLPDMLDFLADEMLQAETLAGVQIMICDKERRGLHLMGSAGFRRLPDFFEKLRECQSLGAHLYMFDAIAGSAPVVVAGRGESFRSDPAWGPMQDYLSELTWDQFASFPLIARGVVVGVLNAFFEPCGSIDEDTMEFIAAMAEQAAIAVDYTDLLQVERKNGRREERQRMARDLHDSVVQQVFSIRMQAQAISALASGQRALPTDMVTGFATELDALSQTALADLRALVHQLRPVLHPAGGLRAAIQALAQSTTNRTGLRLRLSLDADLGMVDGELADDLYRILAEAIHNVVKHAEATQAVLHVSIDDHVLDATLSDDGRGITPDDGPDAMRGLGLRSMDERARQWGGGVTVERRPRRGTVVRVRVPVPAVHPSIAAPPTG